MVMVMVSMMVIIVLETLRQVGGYVNVSIKASTDLDPSIIQIFQT